MRRKVLMGGCLATAMLSLLGCYHEKYKLKVKHPEDLVLPPNEPRFDNPPEEDYRPPPKKRSAADINKGSNGGSGGGFGK